MKNGGPGITPPTPPFNFLAAPPSLQQPVTALVASVNAVLVQIVYSQDFIFVGRGHFFIAYALRADDLISKNVADNVIDVDYSHWFFPPFSFECLP
jgi:hypothetical protein